jgi:DsbC/DsbD-like thiol-disulfide interchange protein
MAYRHELQRRLSSPLGWVLTGVLTVSAVAPPVEAAPASRSGGAESEQRLVEAQLVCDAAVIEPGGTFQLGVLFRMAPGWHVYWKNPGDAGLATDVKFHLPEGLRAGALRWPAPGTFGQGGDIIGYGYDKQVLLWATVTASQALRPGRSVELRVEAAWLACKDKCVIGAKSLSLRLPVGASGRPANRKLFALWRRRLPVGARDKASGLTASSIAGRIGPGKITGRFTLDVSWSAPPAKVQWYPAAGDDLEIKDLSVQTSRGRTVVTFTVTSLAGVTLKSESLETVLVGVDAAGVRRAIRLDVRLRGPARRNNKPSIRKTSAASQPSPCNEAKGAPK